MSLSHQKNVSAFITLYQSLLINSTSGEKLPSVLFTSNYLWGISMGNIVRGWGRVEGAGEKQVSPYSRLPQLLDFPSRNEIFIVYIIAVRNNELLIAFYYSYFLSQDSNSESKQLINFHKTKVLCFIARMAKV